MGPGPRPRSCRLRWRRGRFQFGLSVSVSGGVALVGAYFDDDRGIDSGSAYFFNGSSPHVMPPVVQTPAAQSHTRNQSVNLQIQASDPEDLTLTYQALSLPPGLSLNAQSGLISGTPTVVGLFRPVISVHNGSVAAVTSFDWTITSPAPTNRPSSRRPPTRPTSSATPSPSRSRSATPTATSSWPRSMACPLA
jgi:hypothetical protein